MLVLLERWFVQFEKVVRLVGLAHPERVAYPTAMYHPRFAQFVRLVCLAGVSHLE
jgi:hypothetical protein